MNEKLIEVKNLSKVYIMGGEKNICPKRCKFRYLQK